MLKLHKFDQLLAVEILSLTFVITATISSIFIMSRFPLYADFLFSAPHVGTSFLMVILYILPSILKSTIPVSTFIASAITLMKMSSERELEAWMSCGVSIFRIIITPTIIGIFVTLSSLWSGLYFEQYSNRQFEQYKWLQSKSLVEAFIQENLNDKVFIYNFGDQSQSPISTNSKLALYFGKINSEKTKMDDVFISFSTINEKYSSVIIAKSAELLKETDKGYPDYIFKLKNGTIFSLHDNVVPIEQIINKKIHSNYIFNTQSNFLKNKSLFPNPSDWTTINFNVTNLSLVSLFKNKFIFNDSSSGQNSNYYPSEIFPKLYYEVTHNPNWKKEIEIFSKIISLFKLFSISLCATILPAIGVCLGISDPRRKQIYMYFGIGFIIFIMYSMQSLTANLAQKLIVPPYFVLFNTPLCLFLILALLLRLRLKYPPSSTFLDFLKNEMNQFLTYFYKKGRN